MTEQLVSLLKCLKCGAGDFDITVNEKNAAEIRTGLLTCKSCSERYTIDKGIAEFLVDPPEEILNEIKGTKKGLYEDGKLHELSTEEAIVKMPYVHAEDTYGFYESLAANFDSMLEKMNITEGISILDIGASNCWSTNRFAELGSYAVATDISTVLYSGLESADFFFKKGAYFERVQADMNNMPFMDKSFDYIFLNNALHHSSHIEKVMKQTYSILKKGGKLFLVGEPTYGLFSKKEEFGKDERDKYQINENIYPFLVYKKVMKKAGYRRIKFFFPPAIDLKISSGEFGWKRVNKSLFKLLHLIWKVSIIRAIIKKFFMIPAALLYNFQVHAIAEKR